MLGDDGVQKALRTHNQIVRDTLEQFGGTEVKHTGDRIIAYFSTTSTGVEASIVIQRLIAEHNETKPDLPLRIKLGLNTGAQTDGAVRSRRSNSCARRDRFPVSKQKPGSLMALY